METINRIPIVILHRNDVINLEIMLKSIYENTNYNYDLFLVDNNTSVGMEHLLILAERYNINIILSKKNNWLLGFNLVFKHEKWRDDYPYYIFSDCDIEVPSLGTKCWLTRMIAEMDQNACIGKLGLSLSVKGIDKGDIFEKIIEQEAQYDKQPTIGSNRIAPVDTTLAIYRKDFFVYNKFKFSVGHATLARPYYYTCRATREMECRHLGWYNRGITNNTEELLPEKIKCFAKYAAYIEPAVLKRADFSVRLYFKIVKPFAKIRWGLNVSLQLFIYYVKNFPRNINKLQNQLR